MKSHRVWKITKAIGARVGVPELHPHAFRHSCGVELLRRSNGNLRAGQEHLRHADIQMMTVYTRLTQSDLQKVISAFDKNNGGEDRASHPAPHGTLTLGRRLQQFRSGGPNGIRTRVSVTTTFLPYLVAGCGADCPQKTGTIKTRRVR
jgi:hypothetical protein